MNPEQKQNQDHPAHLDDFSDDLSAVDAKLQQTPWQWSDPALVVKVVEALEKLPVDHYPS